MNIQQIHDDMNNGIIVCSATLKQLAAYALRQTAALTAAQHRLEELAPHYSGLFRSAIERDLELIREALK